MDSDDVVDLIERVPEGCGSRNHLGALEDAEPVAVEQALKLVLKLAGSFDAARVVMATGALARWGEVIDHAARPTRQSSRPDQFLSHCYGRKSASTSGVVMFTLGKLNCGPKRATPHA